MATVPHKAFYAHLESDHEVLTMDEHGAILPQCAADALTTITPAHVNFLSVHGEIGLAECARLADVRRGGYAAIACGRA